MNLKKNILIIAAVILVVLSMPVMAQDMEDVNEAVSEETPEVAAYVNGEEISMQELEQFAGVRNILMQILQSNQEFGSVLLQTEAGQNVVEEFRQLKLEQLITNELLVQEARDRGLEVSNEEMNNIFDQQVNALKQQNNLNDEQLEQAIQQQGFESMQQYKDMFFENNMNGFLVNKLREEVVNEVSVSDEEAREYYDNNQQQFETSEQKKVSHILFDDQAKAEEVLAEINNGADFAEMAREHSTGPTAENGGDLGFITANEQGLDRTFRDAAMELEVGEVTSEPVETQFGFHLIKVTDSREAGMREFEEVKSQIKSQLRSQKQNQAFQEFVEGLREEAEIDIRL
ncbi:peptidyl-prolyl cis-trans isomerase C/foldase protein PrsA [Halanaerobium saccharolyticum]|uniref:Peptidyl-prolyl cis-trans isomerase C/foldase protein PrsA n=1 Tax=Halanaerobium saccharolyticum TaxID=43595 RepID=A0A4R7Z232_9FIRM|nr:peptidyl-prolyl cis-trans isomerase [Halanaerobium saccharolyticum]RAK06918.1 peptidyl-prolyl cis-trans isomerase C/foldase protein PrsA [Halanaerobium saccharolyticum]TDW01645.1 peptidyl-prolyl cis-trans isomerase C/foldase protein PrsA [Halanaerobium saccharolyticum]TDX53043.1 peptidyl-prolyl cis-trans isomerase C/foldase protein PrsA [Halanaerobium saccharolyticum]